MGQMQSLNCLCSYSHKVVTYAALSQLWKIFSHPRSDFNCFLAVKQVKELQEHCSLIPNSILNLIHGCSENIQVHAINILHFNLD